MPLTDLSLAELQTYSPDVAEPEDFDAFWSGSIAEARSYPLDLRAELVDNKLALLDTYDLTFAGWGGTPVRAWLHVPAGAGGPLPTVVQYHGYSMGRGFPYSSTLWAQAGYAQLVMDTRGQGWAVGGPSATADAAIESGENHSPGFMTAGILDPSTYYYRRVYLDAVRLLEAAGELELVDEHQMVVTGGSQGGGLAIAAAGLAPLAGVRLLGAAPDVPFLCHFVRAVEVSPVRPYTEIVEYLAGWRQHAEAAYRTLSYVDGVNLARRAEVPALFSVALMDPVCPPSTVYAAHHLWGSRAVDRPPSEIRVYPHNGHEGGGAYQLDVQLDWFAALFGG
ncbi:acetylxylan esterase [uncultured Friedmanniella sp.]|uniref:acetylxylan esterase n=1 Tax=uncultured Friedmanniella sp. TaxID=335381 RepID=UPI0035C9D312